MFRQETRTAGFVFALFVLFFVSCGTSRILGLQPQEAAQSLYRGDVGFIVRAELPADFSQAVSRLGALTRVHPAAPFYAGLLAGSHNASAEQNRNLQMLLFSAALESPSLPARREAGNRLIRLILEAGEPQEVEGVLGFLAASSARGRPDLVRAAALYRAGRYGESLQFLPAHPAGDWERALSLFAGWRLTGDAFPDEAKRQEITEFLFSLPAGDARRWAYTEALAIDGLLGPGERGVIFSRRFPVSHAITLNNMRPALEDGGLLFFHYPALIGDLARAYQFTPAMREEGLRLFRAWDSLLANATLPPFFLAADSAPEQYLALQSFVRTLDAGATSARRYLILHHAGRIERVRNQFAASSEYFWRALEFAPDTLQSDACFWFILMNTLAHNPSATAPLVLRTMREWDDMSTFNGILDRLSRYLAAGRQWDTMLEVFLALEHRGLDASRAGTSRAGNSLAQYAWILGRVVQEGLLQTNRSAESFFRVAFEDSSGSLYYRTMAALMLGENVSPASDSRDSRAGARRAAQAPVTAGGELEFLLGFFEMGAASFALPYIRALEDGLSIPELRRVAQALAQAENWAESMRLVNRYVRREGHQISREDLYLSHPRPFVETIERHANETGIRPEVLFGLVRTESFFGAGAVSHAGAVGLAQLMPATAQDIAVRIVRAGGPDLRGPNGINLTDPEVNVHLGAFYLRHLITNQMGGNTMLALKAYNGGQGRVRRWLAEDRARGDGGLPLDLFLETLLYPETRNYGRLVLTAAAIYGYLYYGRSMEEVARGFFWQYEAETSGALALGR
ncbi:MAG: lytic transglycosylase domain-containing protein [Treponema sp.]|nr:lytic transglycosylase domain-containing protein [Treponema sp.]